MERRKQEDELKRVQQQEEHFRRVKVRTFRQSFNFQIEESYFRAKYAVLALPLVCARQLTFVKNFSLFLCTLNIFLSMKSA